MPKITLIDKETQEPLVILQQDEKGLRVAGGDASVLDQLGLSQAVSIDQIAEQVNTEDSPVQAIRDEDEAPPEEEAGADMDDRIKPAVKILKELLQRAAERQKKESEDQHDEKYAQAEQTMGAEIIQDKPSQIYVSLDGDNIGNAVARAEASDDEAKLSEISQRINAGQKVLTDWAMYNKGVVVEAGGDEGLVRVPSTAFNDIENLRSLYAKVVGATCTVGVGARISESTKARELGKLRGKNQTVTFDQSTEQELELRMKDQDQSESAKIRQAMNPDGAGQLEEPGQDQQEDRQESDDTSAEPQEDQGDESEEGSANQQYRPDNIPKYGSLPEGETPEPKQAPSEDPQAADEPEMINGKPVAVHEPDEEQADPEDGYDDFGYQVKNG